MADVLKLHALRKVALGSRSDCKPVLETKQKNEGVNSWEN